MKKNFKYAFMSAIALLGAVSFTACQSSDEIVENPNYDPETNMVNTQFVLNVASYPTNNATRQGIATVQQDNNAATGKNFRGMQNATLIALKTENSFGEFSAPFNGENIAAADMQAYDMGTLYTKDYVDNRGTTNSTSSSHRILRMKLPVGSDAMLIYARAIPQGSDAENGKVAFNVTASDPKSSSFSLVSRLGTGTSSNKTKYDNTCAMIAKILNYILDSSVEGETGGDTYGSYSTTEDLPNLVWKTMNGSSELEISLQTAYTKIAAIDAEEYRDGSASGILYQIYNLYVVIRNTQTATATSKYELNAQRLADEIGKRIEEFFESPGAEETIEFKSMSAIGTAFSNHNWETNFSTVYTISDTELAEFPSSLGLPHGVALLYSATDGVSYKNSNLTLTGNTDALSPEKYMYPAELLYFDNSTLRVNSSEVTDDNFPNGYSNWNTGFGTGGWSVGSIGTGTRSIAVTNNINYGVAMLKTKVAGTTGVTYKDNRANLTAETTNQEIDITTLKLNGILIGGQNNVGWNYISSATSAGDQIIYDNSLVSTTIPTPGSGDNYTMVFDNYVNNTDQSSKVYVALEFKNGAKAFYGKKNLVQANGYFYLVGELDMANGGSSLTWDDTYPIPPYDSTGKSTKTPRIFIQDHVTTATFTIGEFSLQHAFLTVPDMREVQTSLGLSVNLDWQPGMTFTSTLGGDQISNP